MPEERRDFHFHVAGIEDGVSGVLQALHGGEAGYLKETVATYSGELDEKTFKEFVESLGPRFPLFLVAYTDGDDVLAPATSAAGGQPRTFRHDCTFGVIACDDNARGETERRRGSGVESEGPGVIKMISDARDDLGGLQLARRFEDNSDFTVAVVPGKALPEGDVLLTSEPLKVTGVRCILRASGLTAYMQYFDTSFKWTEPDRRGATTAVSELIFAALSTQGESEPGTKPGVVIK